MATGANYSVLSPFFGRTQKGRKIVGTKYGWAISTKLIFMGVAVNKLNVAR